MSELDSKSLRTILTEAFDDEDLTYLCYDHFSPVYEKFSVGMTKSQKVHLLIDHCKKRGEFPKLLNLLRRDNPAAFSELPQSPIPSQHAGIVHQHIGDIVIGDKISGDIHASDISSGEGCVIGHKGQLQLQQGGVLGTDLARIFTVIYQQHINDRPIHPDIDHKEIIAIMNVIQQEAQKGEQANEQELVRLLTSLVGISEDVFKAMVAMLTDPQMAFASVVRRAAEKASKEEGGA